MFGKKCSKCSNRIKGSFEYCPYCGKDLRFKHDDKDFGLLGKSDLIDNVNPPKRGSFIDKIFNNAMKEIPAIMKMIERQMQNQTNDFNQGKLPSNLNVQFFVNGKKVAPQKKERPVEPIKETKISRDRINKLSKLPKKEPASKIRRLSGKVIYELEVPGVKNIDDVLINQLENSIEIKAISKNKIYSKRININLPILGYQLIKNNLILELADGS